MDPFPDFRNGRNFLGIAACAWLLLGANLSTADHAQAEKIAAEAKSALARRDLESAERLWGQAIDADPTFAKWAANRGTTRYMMLRWPEALQDFARSLELNAAASPADPTTERDVRACRENIYYEFGQLRQALDDIEWVIGSYPDYPGIHEEYGRTFLACGRFEEGQRELDKALAANPNSVTFRAWAFLLKADWEGAEAEARKNLGKGTDYTLNLAIVASLAERGRLQDAEAFLRPVLARDTSAGSTLAYAYLVGTPGWPGFSVDEALRTGGNIRAGVGEWSEIAQVEGRALVLGGRYDEAISVLEAHAPRVSFEVLFWKGVAFWKLEKFAEARTAFLQARRVNPSLIAHASRVPGLASFLEPIDREGADEVRGSDAIRVLGDQETLLFTVNEIEDMARSFHFAQAAGEYRKLADAFSSPLRKSQATDRATELEDAAAVLNRLVEAASGHKLTTKVRVRGLDVTIKSATASDFEFEVKGATGKLPWAGLSAADFAALAEKVSPKPQELFALGVVSWERGDALVGARLMDAAVRKDAKLAARKDAAVSRLRGVPAPKEGFLYFKEAWQTPEEKSKIEKGLVRFGGQWVPKADRDQLAKGLVKNDGKWAPQSDDALKKSGFRKYKDQWLSGEDYAARRSKWDEAWEEETAHYKIRSNVGEAFVHDLAGLVEVAYADLKAFYGREPKLDAGHKMILYAFQNFDEYRKYCVENNAEYMIAAGGFARSNSEQVVGWNKQKDTSIFLQTMVHEASHLYFYRSISVTEVPSWYAEGMATYFEGFRHKGGQWKFDHRPLHRIAAVRDAVQRGKHIPLADLPRFDAGSLINSDASKALLFYAESWALTYFLTTTDNKAYRDAFQEFRKGLDAGGRDPLSKFIPDAEKLEKDFIAFVRGL